MERIPAAEIDSFAGVGYFLDLASRCDRGHPAAGRLTGVQDRRAGGEETKAGRLPSRLLEQRLQLARGPFAS
jgi:hypothetical protein